MSNPSDMPGPSRTKNDEVANTQSRELNPIHVRLPPFWPNNLNTWFIQVESNFSISRISQDISKYNYLIAALPQDVAESLSDFLEKPPTENLYNKLKEVIISRHSLSIEKRIRRLVSDEEIGDKKPSEFYRRMKTLAGTSGTVGEELVKKLWLGRLPNVVKIALIPQVDDDLDQYLDTADKVWEAMQSSGNISTMDNYPYQNIRNNGQGHNDDRFNRLENEISELKNMISRMGSSNNRNSRSRDRGNNFSRNRSNSRGRKFDVNGSLCWYHFKFADKAQKCSATCKWKSTKDSNTSQYLKN